MRISISQKRVIVEFPTISINNEIRQGEPSADLLLDGIQDAAKDIDLVALKFSAPEKSAQLGHQSFWVRRIEKARRDHHALEMRIEALDIAVKRGNEQLERFAKTNK